MNTGQLINSTSTVSTGAEFIMRVPLGQPLLRERELDGNSTRFEQLSAAPSQHSMVIMWSLLAFITGLVAVFVLSMLLSIVLSHRARKNPFHLYLAFMLMADAFGNTNCHMTCLLSAIKGEYWSESMCLFQSFYSTFLFTASSWMNALVTRQLYLMLSSASHYRRYHPPSSSQVIKEACCVYAYSAVMASAGLIPYDWWPLQTATASGIGCVPLEGTTTLSKVTFYLLF
jgi:hypothetical protein